MSRYKPTSEYDPTISTGQGRHRFTVSTRLMKDDRIETPVSGATRIVAARGGENRLDLFSIGSDGHIHHFTREGSQKWNRHRLPFKASSLHVVPQRDGTDKVFFIEWIDPNSTEGDAEKIATVYELENAGREPQRRRFGRFVTTDPKVNGVGELSGAQCRDASNLLVSSLEAHPGSESSKWMVLFGHGSSTGALSLQGGKGVVADKVLVAGEDPGSARWPHMTFVLLLSGELRVEWGSRSGVLLQTESLPIPKLSGVAEFDLVRDHRGHLKIFALDAERQLHVLCQIGGGGSRAPRWASSWLRLDSTQCDGRCPKLRKLHALRRSDGDLEVFALDEEDRLWSITERSLAGASGPDASGLDTASSELSETRWSRLHELGVRAAHIAVASVADNLVEVFAVSRQNQLLWLRRDHQENWRLRRISWDASESARTALHVYHTGLTVLDQEHEAVPEMPIQIKATERLPSIVNGLSYVIGPCDPVTVKTNAFGKIGVAFEFAQKRPVPSLSFEAGFLDGGLLDVCPERKAHLYVRGNTKKLLRDASTDSRAQLFLIPEDTVIEQA